MIYFLQAVDGGPIKIGHALDLERRVYAVQCQSPVQLRLLATAPGTMREEGGYHYRLRDHRSHGEWFHPAPEVLAAVAAADPWAGEAIHFGPPRVGRNGGRRRK